MFGGPFNRLPFNRPITMFVFGRAVLSGCAGLVAVSAVEMNGQTIMDGESGMSSDFIREISFAARMDADSGMAVDFIRERLQTAIMHGISSLQGKASRYHVDEIEFTGPFVPGDIIVIDSEKFKITRNGENVSHLYNGDFFDLNLGTNNLTWTDPATGRTILFRITHRDKFLY
ncbi:phage distal tail protein [Paenibacillus lactis]|uniref:Siphovirus-type tail component C-terminal domain-containing protein n=1 Tax=Paenibacillus lactis TaxID=228574 RepID=A0ABS4F9P8_9BACL|nr:hypothetical protein [Paenibacillus lactis]MBP1892976.1 hypothetical protein [Paenibacillus lactis]HAF97552.1 hypothetical protein [Paenibacillus lactis]